MKQVNVSSTLQPGRTTDDCGGQTIEIKDNHFAIKTDKPHVKVSWQVTGVRHDGYVNAHRVPVEEEKAQAERGTYLTPGCVRRAFRGRAGPTKRPQK